MELFSGVLWDPRAKMKSQLGVCVCVYMWGFSSPAGRSAVPDECVFVCVSHYDEITLAPNSVAELAHGDDPYPHEPWVDGKGRTEKATLELPFLGLEVCLPLVARSLMVCVNEVFKFGWK